MNNATSYLKYHAIILCFLSLLLGDCSAPEKSDMQKMDYLFSKISSQQTGINFINKVTNRSELNIFKYRNFYNGGGVAIGDINNDGLDDVYFTSNMEKNKLFLNQGDLVFKEITETAGVAGMNTWSTGVVLVDINADSFLDIYVCNAGNVEGDNQQNELYINNGDLTFSERAVEYNLAENGFTTHAAFFDYDRDGDLDVYILNNSFIPVSSLGYNNKRHLRGEQWDVPEILKGGGDKLFRNDGKKFTDVSEEAGIYGSLIGFGLGVTLGDMNGDQWPDIYVSNDFYERDYMYLNQGDGTFKEDIKNATPHLSMASMGADMGDINNDGLPEIFVTDMLPESDQRLKNTSEFETYDLHEFKKSQDFHDQFMQNTLHFNNGNGTFSEIAHFSGVSKTDWSWGALMFDMDNDGFKDIYVCNGIYHDLTNMDFMNFFANDIIQKMVVTGKKESVDSVINKMPSTPIANYAFQNRGDLTFDNKAKEWGLNDPSFSNGSAYGDLDNDGDLDLVVNNVNQPAMVYENQTDKRLNTNYIKINLKGGAKNTYGIGSIISLFLKDQIILHEVYPSRGFQSSVSYQHTIGLGDAVTIDSMKIVWPTGEVQKIGKTLSNQQIQLEQKDANQSNERVKISEITTFKNKTNSDFDSHQENHFVDFDHEGLISKMLSKEGPTVAVGDMNGDGLDDVFIGAAKGEVAQYYFQTDRFRFAQQSDAVFQFAKEFEDVASVMLDADDDGDLDLLVGSGGNEKVDKNYPIRLYRNNGEGQLTLSESDTYDHAYNSAALAVHDFDGDGDIDVFVGSLSVPGMYGITPQNLLLENDGKGNFTNEIDDKAFHAKKTGMIRSAKWADMDMDGIKDLVVAGEWMSPRIFRCDGRRLSPLPSSLDSLYGMWNTIVAEDIDEDGDIDLILGNRGQNFSYSVSTENPGKVYINDFDNNGTLDQIFTHSIDGQDVPIHLKSELTKQLSFLKKRNVKYSAYAKNSIHDLFEPALLERSVVKILNTEESGIAINQGNGQFDFQAFPKEAQFSSIRAIEVFDLNHDGWKDIVIAGNDYDFKPQFGRLDASYGMVLFGTEDGRYIASNAAESGLFVKGQVRSMNWIEGPNGTKYLFVGINDAQPETFELHE